MDGNLSKNNGLWLIAGGLGLAHLALMLAGFSLQRVAPLGSRRTTIVADHVTWSMTKGFSGGYLVCLSFIAFMLFATLLARLLRGTSELSAWLASAIAALGAIYVAVTLGAGLSDLGAALYGGHHGAPLAIVTAFDQAHWFAVFVATTVLGAFTLTVGAAVWVSGLLPRWVAASGLVAGAVVLAGVAAASTDAVNDATAVWMLWFVALAIAALRAGRTHVRPARVEPATAR